MEGGAVTLDPDEKVIFNITINGTRHTYEQQPEPRVIDGEVTQLGKS
jgi:hypothetical protein